MAEKRPAGWPERIRASSLSAQGSAVSEPPEPACIVGRLHRTTDTPRAHLWPTFLCEEKGGAAGGSPAKRLYSLATANQQNEAYPGHSI